MVSEEILNPSVPMALRLSGILMGETILLPPPNNFSRIFWMDFYVLCSRCLGGVVIVYERKVNLLYGKLLPLHLLVIF